jgi:hypothetical protein
MQSVYSFKKRKEESAAPTLFPVVPRRDPDPAVC